MSFQIPTTTAAPASGGFSFGLPAAAAAAKPSAFTFGANAGAGDAAPKPLTFGAVAPAATPVAAATTTTAAVAPLTGFAGFGTPATSTAPTLPTLGGFGAVAPATAAVAPLGGGLTGFGAAAVPPATTTTAAPAALPTLGGFNAPPMPTAQAPAPALTFGAVAAAQPAAKPAVPVLTGFGTTAMTTPAATPAPGFSVTKTTAAPTLGLGLSAPTATVTPAATTAGGFASLSTATKTTDSAAVSNATQMSYNQLEELINKWTLELEEQEKVFVEQATQINAWDKVLINNNHKILELNDAVQKVKNDQQMLEQELEFIATQHKELEESIAPLQKEFSKIPQVDVERSQTYLMVENLDTQLKQMSEDLKEIIDNLNESNKGQDNTDPIIQIGKILNAHMSSLQWIETSAANIGYKLDDINKMHESFKRDSERSFRSAYNN